MAEVTITIKDTLVNGKHGIDFETDFGDVTVDGEGPTPAQELGLHLTEATAEILSAEMELHG